MTNSQFLKKAGIRKRKYQEYRQDQFRQEEPFIPERPTPQQILENFLELPVDQNFFDLTRLTQQEWDAIMQRFEDRIQEIRDMEPQLSDDE